MGSKLRSRHPHPPDDRDSALGVPRGMARGLLRDDANERPRDARDVANNLTPTSDLDAPLPDSRDAEREARHWADVRERLERLLRDPDLSEKTQAFLESLDDQLTRRGSLSENQVNAIIEIEDRRDSGKRRY